MSDVLQSDSANPGPVLKVNAAEASVHDLTSAIEVEEKFLLDGSGATCSSVLKWLADSGSAKAPREMRFTDTYFDTPNADLVCGLRWCCCAQT